MQDKKNFDLLREETEQFYKSISEVWCPYLHCTVRFTHGGWSHLFFKGNKHSRSTKEQCIRARLLKTAVSVLSMSHTVQGIEVKRIFVTKRVNGRKEKVVADTIYYEFIAVMNDWRTKVIVSKIENGTPIFWSVIPAWRTRDKNTVGVSSSSDP